MIKGQSYNEYMIKEFDCSFFLFFCYHVSFLFFRFFTHKKLKLIYKSTQSNNLETMADHFNYT